MSKKRSGREEEVKLESSHRLFEMQTNVVPHCLERHFKTLEAPIISEMEETSLNT